MLQSSKISKYILFSSIGAFSGSILYNICMDIYKIYIKKTQPFISPLKYYGKQLINPGLILGFGIGLLRTYIGKPLTLTKIIKNN